MEAACALAWHCARVEERAFGWFQREALQTSNQQVPFPTDSGLPLAFAVRGPVPDGMREEPPGESVWLQT